MLELYYLFIWTGLTCLLWVFWRRARKNSGGEWDFMSIVLTAVAGLWLVASFWQCGGQNLYYDAKIRSLCAKDGGVKVYETVELPAEKFNQWGNVDIPSGKNAEVSDEYFSENTTTYIRQSNPSLWRSHTMILRRFDGKVLGEAVSYHRVGRHPSSFGCPKPSELHFGIQSIFIKEADK